MGNQIIFRKIRDLGPYADDIEMYFCMRDEGVVFGMEELSSGECVQVALMPATALMISGILKHYGKHGELQEWCSKDVVDPWNGDDHESTALREACRKIDFHSIQGKLSWWVMQSERQGDTGTYKWLRKQIHFIDELRALLPGEAVEGEPAPARTYEQGVEDGKAEMQDLMLKHIEKNINEEIEHPSESGKMALEILSGDISAKNHVPFEEDRMGIEKWISDEIDWDYDFESEASLGMNPKCIPMIVELLKKCEAGIGTHDVTTDGGVPRCGWRKIKKVGMMSTWPHYSSRPAVMVEKRRHFEKEDYWIDWSMLSDIRETRID
jgi:hypothetical protein